MIRVTRWTFATLLRLDLLDRDFSVRGDGRWSFMGVFVTVEADGWEPEGYEMHDHALRAALIDHAVHVLEVLP
jgi:hypothetical protein